MKKLLIVLFLGETVMKKGVSARKHPVLLSTENLRLCRCIKSCKEIPLHGMSSQLFTVVHRYLYRSRCSSSLTSFPLVRAMGTPAPGWTLLPAK